MNLVKEPAIGLHSDSNGHCLFFLGGRAKCLSGWFMALIYFQTKKVSQSAHLFEHGGGSHIAIWEMPVGILIF